MLRTKDLLAAVVQIVAKDLTRGDACGYVTRDQLNLESLESAHENHESGHVVKTEVGDGYLAVGGGVLADAQAAESLAVYSKDRQTVAPVEL